MIIQLNMARLVNKPTYQIKLQKFKQGGQIQKCGFGDIIEKGAAYIFNGQSGTFQEAFANARKAGQKYFRWNGSLYNTSLASNQAAITPTKQALQTKLSKQQYNEAANVWQYLMDKGVSPRNAAAIMGNIMQESSFNRGAVQKGGDGAVGFFQMHGQDLNAYNTWKSKNKGGKYPEIDYVLYMIDSKDHPYTNEYRRVQGLPKTPQNKKYIQDVYGPRERTDTLYLIDNLNTVWNDNTTPLNDITDLFTNTIERAGKPEYQKRQGYATDFYNHFYGN